MLHEKEKNSGWQNTHFATCRIHTRYLRIDTHVTMRGTNLPIHIAIQVGKIRILRSLVARCQTFAFLEMNGFHGYPCSTLLEGIPDTRNPMLGTRLPIIGPYVPAYARSKRRGLINKLLLTSRLNSNSKKINPPTSERCSDLKMNDQQ